eukprot:4518097-Amphidinium_carterae.1
MHAAVPASLASVRRRMRGRASAERTLPQSCCWSTASSDKAGRQVTRGCLINEPRHRRPYLGLAA